MNFGVSSFDTAADEPNLTPKTPGMAHMTGNEPNFWYFIKKYEVKKSVPKKCKTAWALGLKLLYRYLPFFSKNSIFVVNPK